MKHGLLTPPSLPTGPQCCSFSEQELVDCTNDGKNTCNIGAFPRFYFRLEHEVWNWNWNIRLVVVTTGTVESFDRENLKYKPDSSPGSTSLLLYCSPSPLIYFLYCSIALLLSLRLSTALLLSHLSFVQAASPQMELWKSPQPWRVLWIPRVCIHTHRGVAPAPANAALQVRPRRAGCRRGCLVSLRLRRATRRLWR